MTEALPESPISLDPHLAESEPEVGSQPTAAGASADRVPSRSLLRTPLGLGIGGLIAGILVGVLATLGIQGVVSQTVAAQKDTRLADAVLTCGASDGIDLSDEDQTLTIDMKGEEDAYGASYSHLQCILTALDVPGSVSSHMGQTTSMDGRQTESWAGLTLAWSYHPDRGADSVITIDKPTR